MSVSLRTGLWISLLAAAPSVFGADSAVDRDRLLIDGRIDAFINSWLASGAMDDSRHLLAVGNVLYRLDLARATELHQKAAELAPHDDEIRLELAYDYTAAGRCGEAVEIWDALEHALPLKSGTAAIAAHCYVASGRFDDAVRYWERSEFPRSHVGIEKSIHNVFGRPDAASQHADGFKRYRSDGWSGSGEWVRNSGAWQLDWWNTGPNAKAFEGIKTELTASRDEVALRELNCFLDSSEGSSSESQSILNQCGLLGEAPVNSGVAYLIALNLGREAFATLDRAWSEQLKRKALRGDVVALELLGAFAASNGEQSRLAELDELGWKRFGLPSFALSRLYGLGLAEATLSTDLEKQLSEAAAQFPRDSRIQMQALTRLHRSGAAYRDALARLIVAEYYSLRHSSGAEPNARGLDGFFGRLASAQSALAEGRVPSIDAPDGFESTD